MAAALQRLLILAFLLALDNKLIFAREYIESRIAAHVVTVECQEAALNCTTHWDMVPFIAPVGLCEEYFPIECLAELVVSKNCKDDAGYGEFLTSLATDIDDCVKSGMKWTAVFLKRMIQKAVYQILCHKTQLICYNVTNWNPANGTCDLEFAGCIMDSFGDEYCAKVGDELEQAFFQCLSGASRCRNKEEMIIECEKEYLDHSRQSTEKIDREFEMADANQTRYQDKKK